MVNAAALKEQIGKAPPNLPNGGELFKHIFSANMGLRKFWDMEDIEPDQVAKSRAMQQKGAGFLSTLNHLVASLDNDKAFKQEVAEMRDSYKELGLKMDDVKKLMPGIIDFFEAKLGKLKDAHRTAWAEFFDKYTGALKEAGFS